MAPAGDRYRVLGYTTEMPQLLRDADLFVGKPGGLSASECMAAGLPMVLVNPIPGQEVRNGDYLMEQGAAVRCNTPSTIGWKIDEVLRRAGSAAADAGRGPPDRPPRRRGRRARRAARRSGATAGRDARRAEVDPRRERAAPDRQRSHRTDVAGAPGRPARPTARSRCCGPRSSTTCRSGYADAGRAPGAAARRRRWCRSGGRRGACSAACCGTTIDRAARCRRSSRSPGLSTRRPLGADASGRAPSQLTGLCWAARSAHSPGRGDQRRVAGIALQGRPGIQVDPHDRLGARRAASPSGTPAAEPPVASSDDIGGVDLHDRRALAVAGVASRAPRRCRRCRRSGGRAAGARTSCSRGRSRTGTPARVPVGVEQALAPPVVVDDGLRGAVERRQVGGVGRHDERQPSAGLRARRSARRRARGRPPCRRTRRAGARARCSRHVLGQDRAAADQHDDGARVRGGDRADELDIRRGAARASCGRRRGRSATRGGRGR